jgi:cytidylate kinase
MEYLQVAIDGPAGSGKSTIAKGLAKKLGFLFINSGAFYRAVTVAVIENKISLTDEKKIINLLKKLSVTQINDDIYLNNQNVSNKC